MLSPLRIIARHGLEEVTGSGLDAPLDGTRWAFLLSGVRRHRLMGLLGAAVDDGALPVSAEQRAEVEAIEVAAASSALRLERALLAAAEVLHGRGIDFRVLKGPAVAHLDYEDPMLRHFGDIDLLVPARSLEDTAAALVEAGGERCVGELAPGFDRRFGKGYTIAMPTGCELDVHRTLVAGTFGLRLDPEELFTTSARFGLGGEEIAALADEERFLHAAFHAALGDRRPRLTAVRDVVQIGSNPAVDWGRVRDLVGRWRCDAVVERALDQVSERLQLEIFPHRIRRELDLSSSRRDRRAVQAYLATDGRFARQALGAIPEVRGWRAKVAYVRALALPSGSNLRGRGRRRAAHVLRGIRHAVTEVFDR